MTGPISFEASIRIMQTRGSRLDRLVLAFCEAASRGSQEPRRAGLARVRRATRGPSAYGPACGPACAKGDDIDPDHYCGEGRPWAAHQQPGEK